MSRVTVFDVNADQHPYQQADPGGKLPMSIEIDTAAAKLWVTANAKTKELTLKDPSDGQGVFRATVQDPDALTTSGLKLPLALELEGLGFDEVRLEYRPDKPEQGWSTETPHLTLTFCDEMTAKTGAEVGIPDGKIAAGADISLRLCAGIAIIAPPAEAEGISNIAVKIDLPDFGVGSGWIPLSILDPGKFSDFHMPGVIDWFQEIVGDLGTPDIAFPVKWDADLSLALDFPVGLRPQSTRFQLRNVDSKLRISVTIDGLDLLWDGQTVLPYDDFHLGLLWDGTTYVLKATFAKFQYPEDTSTERYGFALPFDTLSVTAQAWYFQLGIFGHNDGMTNRFCFDVLLEVGDLQVSALGETLYQTDLRLNLRDLVLMTKELDPGTKFFSQATLVNANSAFKSKDIPAISFAKDLSAMPPPENDYGLTILNGDYQKDRRLFLAWRQHSISRLFRALMHNLIGTEAAGALPEDAKPVDVALEIAWFGKGETRDTQVRLDVRPGVASSSKGATIPAGTLKDCYSLSEVTDGILLPGGAIADTEFDKISTGSHPFTFGLPGLDFQVRRPTTHTLLYRRDGGDTDSLAWIVAWGAGLKLREGDALAAASIDFAMTGSDGKRQVQPAEGGKFLQVSLGGSTTPGTSQAVQLLGWRDGEAPRYFQVFNGNRNFAILPEGAANDTAPDACPKPPADPWEPVALNPDAFGDFSLKDGGAYQMGLRARIGDVLLKQFGRDQSVSFKITEICLADGNEALTIKTKLNMNLGGKTLEGNINFRLRLSDMALSIEDGAELGLRQPVVDTPEFIRKLAAKSELDQDLVISEPFDLFGFDVYAVTEHQGGDRPKDIQVLTLSMENGEFTLKTPEKTQILFRYEGFGNEGLTFSVKNMILGGGGLDVTAELMATTLKLPGLQKPFALDQARLEITGSKMTDLTIAGSGQMPELLNGAPVIIALTLKQDDDNNIDLVEFDCELGNGSTPIFSRGTRCRFELTKITIDMDNGGGTKPDAWFFRISGSVQMQPEGSELLGNLLEDFKSIRLEFTDAPLGDEFFDHIELIAILNKPERFKVLGLFDMEVRSIGFHPNFKGFSQHAPAIIIGGQIAFADLGDILSVEVDFHRLYLGLPKDGEVLPQTYAKGLRVEISTSGFKIAGRVEYYDEELIDGFAGEGTVLIPGLPELSAAFAFAKLRAMNTDGWKRGWFIAIEAGRISYQIGTLPLYLRQIGLGFGYRYTSVLIKRFESEDRLGPLIKLMLREIENHQSLARIESWAPDPEKDGGRSRWSIGLEAVFSMASANTSPTTYNPSGEQKLQTVLLQLLLFLRSDFTFMAAAKLWFPVSADDFFRDSDGMRRRPLALGFMAYSAPKSRLLIHGAKGKNPYLGRQKDPLKDFLKEMLDNSHFEATFLSEPGLIHAELGWPDRLFFKYKIGALTIECRGGVLFRLEKDLLVQGVYFSARGELSVSAGLSLGIVGTSITAFISVSFGMRLMMGISLSRPLDSKIYAAVGLDISLRFSIHIWFRLNLRFCKISIDIHFSLEIQIVVALEVGWAGQGDIGFRAQASVIIAAFGRGLKVKINVSAGTGVENARAALSPYMRSFLEPGAIPPIPGIDMAERQAVLRNDQELGSLGPQALSSQPLVKSGQGAFLDDSLPPSQPLVIKKDAEEDPKKASFVFAIREGKNVEKGKKAWFGWVMPSPRAGEMGTPLYPPVYYELSEGETEENFGPKDYGKLTFPDQKGIAVFVPKSEADGAITWDEVKETVDGKKVATLQLTPFAKATLTPEVGGEDQFLSLQQLLAGCYVPTSKDDFGDTVMPFPANWKGQPLSNHSLETLATPLKDNRLDEPDHEAINTRRKLDPDHAYDSALMKAIENGEVLNQDPFGEETPDDDAKRRQLEEQALGTQSYLFRSFMDDLTWMAEMTTVNEESMPVTKSFQRSAQPTLADLGMVVCVVAEECPDWLCRFPDGKAEASLEIKKEDIADDKWKVDTPVPPVIDFQDASFALSPPDMEEGQSYVDDETLVFIWSIAWHRTPGSVFDDPEIEDFLDHYRIEVFDEGNGRRLDSAKLNPCDILAPGEDGLTRLKTRFQYVKKLGDLAIDPDRSLSEETQIRANVVPVSQDGSEGDRFEALATYRPSATPLPADGAALRLELAENPERHPHDASTFSGVLYWRQPTPPNDPSVALTERWELILRPVSPLPLGAYPAEAAEAEDTAMTSFAAPGLRDGDIVIAFDADNLPPADPNPDIWEDDQVADEAEASKRFGMEMGLGWAYMQNTLNARIFDHAGKAAEEESDLEEMAKGFFDRRAATEAHGAGWRLFLRASSKELTEVGQSLPETGYGSFSKVSLLLEMPTEPDKSAASADVDGADETGKVAVPEVKEPARFRALDHLEWPYARDAEQVATEDLRHAQGALSLAGVVDDDGELKLEYFQLPGIDRGVTLTWNAVPKSGAPVENTARFVLYEARMDRLVNQDRAEDVAAGFGVEWTEIKQVQLTDPAFAARTTTSFVQPEIWDHMPPVRRETLTRLENVPAEDKARKWPGWYSWSESSLVWPRVDLDAERDLKKGVGEGEASPLLKLVELQNDTPSPDNARAILGELYAVGGHTAKRSLHPWLTCVAGELTRRGAPVYLGGAGEVGDGDAQARFEVEMMPGKPGPMQDDAKPLTWMQQDIDLLDPLGWGGLSHFGLAITVALRDPLTGLYLGQDKARAEFQEAAKRVARLADEARNAAAPVDIVVDLAHLAFDLPLQTAFALRAGGGDRNLDNRAALSMLQVCLRPVPQIWGADPYGLSPNRYYHLERNRDANVVPVDGEGNPIKFTIGEDIEVVFPDRSLDPIKIEAGETDWSVIFGGRAIGEPYVLIRRAGTLSEDISALTELWRVTDPDRPFPYDILSDRSPWRYSVALRDRTVALSDEDVLRDTEVTLPITIDVIYPNRNFISRRFEAGTRYFLADMVSETDGRILLRGLTGEASPLNILHEATLNALPFAEEEIDGQVLAETPMAIFDNGDEPELPISPFGRFEVDDVLWRGLLQTPGSRFASSILTYLARAFVKLPENVEENIAPEDLWLRSTRKLAHEIGALQDFADVYLNWSARYFASTPMATGQDWLDDPLALYTPARLTTATPKRDEPTILAPDELGRLHYTHIVTEDWASLRAYGFRRVPRYWELHRPNVPVATPELEASAGRLDVAIPRRRKVLPPKLIGLRVLTDPDTKRHFHEITHSEHVEAALSRASMTLARKLEFQDLLHHFDLVLPTENVDWIGKLKDIRIVQGDYEIIGAAKADNANIELPAAGLGEDNFLAHVPIARFGSRRILVAAEPYYYAQSMSAAARAVAVASQVVETRLPRPPATQPVPEGAPMPAPVHWTPVTSWTQVGLEALNTLAIDWLDKIRANVGDDLADALTPAMTVPRGASAAIRFPRLFEMLPPTSRTRHFKAETLDNSFGQIPDPDMRLELLTLSTTARNSLASIAAVRDDMNCFRSAVLSEKHAVTIARRDGGATLIERLTFDVAFARLVHVSGWSISPLPDPVLEGRFARLSALRLRMQIIDTTIEVSAPRVDPKWIYRPSLPISNTEEANLDDVATGLHLLLHSAKLAATPPDVLTDNFPMSEFETHALPLLTKPLAADATHTHAFEGAALWHLDSGSGTWSALNEGDSKDAKADDRFLLLISKTPTGSLPSLTDLHRPAFDDFDAAFELEGPPTFDSALADLIDVNRLAAAVWSVWTPEEITVIAHHGNLPGAEWPTQLGKEDKK